MVEQLFGSKTRVKLLRLFYNNPNRAFYVREITRKIDEQINSVRRELANLLSIGIISSETNNNRLYYEVDQQYDLYDPLAKMFSGTPTTSSSKKGKNITREDTRIEALRLLGNVELALYTGQFTRDETSGIDFLLVGDVNQTKLSKYVEDLERSEAIEIRYTVMNPKEYRYRVQINDRFLTLVLGSKKQVLIDKYADNNSKKNKDSKEKK